MNEIKLCKIDWGDESEEEVPQKKSAKKIKQYQILKTRFYP